MIRRHITEIGDCIASTNVCQTQVVLMSELTASDDAIRRTARH
jgi:hypothetical protein